MKKIIILVIAFFVLSSGAYAWLNCNPPSCPAGFVDNGVYCTLSECFRNCTGKGCGGSWSSIFSDQFFFEGDQPWNHQSSASYTSSDTDKCYEFMFDAPNAEIYSSVDQNCDPSGPPTDCDTHAVTGFWESGKPSNPWYENLTEYGDWTTGAYYRYWDDTPPDHLFDYLFVALRGFTEHSSYQDNSYESYMKKDYSFYCAPTQKGCEDVGMTYGKNCTDTCYGHSTYSYIFQGYLADLLPGDTWPARNTELWDRAACSSSCVTGNYYRYPYFRVYTKPTATYTEVYACNRTNEAPTASNVQVLPIQPTAGDDLYCDYEFSDPENYTEKNSTFEWWKNSANQNINSIILRKGNLSVGDSWYCKVTPNDGINNGVQQSSSPVTILTTVKDVELKVEGQTAWQENGYISGERELKFMQELQDAITSCIPDGNGNCNISLTLFSDSTGNIDIERLKIYYETIPNNAPNITSYSPGLNPVINETDSINFSVTAYDQDGNQLYYTWYENGNQLPVNTSWYLKTTDYNSAGAYNVTVVVSDLLNSTSLTWSLTVNNVNQDPLITNLPHADNIPEGQYYSYDVDAIDLDNDTLIFSILNPENGMTIDNSTGLFEWTPEYNQSGVYNLDIKVDDGNGGTDQDMLTITVDNIPQTDIDLYLQVLNIQQGANTTQQMFTFLIRNLGNATVNSYGYKINDTLGNSFVDTLNIPIAQNGVYAGMHRFNYSSGLAGTVTVMLDPDNNIDEWNETNNEKTVAISTG